MVSISKRDLAILVGIAGVVDFAVEGRLGAPLSRAIKKVAKAGAARVFLNPGQVPTNIALARGIGSAAVRAAPRLAGTGLAIGRTIAMRHPLIAAGAVVYVAASNREQIADLVREGFDVVSEGVESIQERFPSPPGFDTGIRLRPRKPSSFNSAVKKGMSIVKQSSSYGKKGTINNAKKAFSAVTKAASAASKKKKAPKSGITRKIYLGVKGLFK